MIDGTPANKIRVISLLRIEKLRIKLILNGRLTVFNHPCLVQQQVADHQFRFLCHIVVYLEFQRGMLKKEIYMHAVAAKTGCRPHGQNRLPPGKRHDFGYLFIFRIIDI